METLSNLAFGLGVALTWQNILYCFVGCFLGTLVGVLPGIGPVATVAMLLPFTFGLGPAPALIMLAGIYYGAQYGGSTTAILVNIPGESSSVVTTLDGHRMARRGRAGPALGIAAIGSFVAGCIATLLIAYFAPPLAELALKFSPAEYFSLMVFGLIAAVVLARGSLIKAIAMVCFGILLGLVGTDVNSGVIRFAFGQAELSDGLGFVALAMAFFGITDVVINLEHKHTQQVFTSRIGSVLPTRADMRACFWSIAPGPQVMTERPELFWGLIASMWVGNLMLLVLNLPLVGLWIQLLAVPYRLLFPAIFVFCCIGAYTVDNKVFDVYALAALSAVAYVLLKLDCEPAPMVLGYILGPMMEENLRRAMMISFGDPTVLITRPISAAFLLAAVALLVAIALPALRAKREEAMQE